MGFPTYPDYRIQNKIHKLEANRSTMKLHWIFTCLFLFLQFSGVQAQAKLKGAIGGKYTIEMELMPNPDTAEAVVGRYHYAGKTSWLDLRGVVFGREVLYLEESSIRS